MPQLYLGPWFAILMFPWLDFLIHIPTKVLNHVTPNELTLVGTEKHKTESWNWPW
uniref:ATP synthase complex subunit 8 n=1 Tax=Herzensteinia microcephalus TaxID=361642 RepID=A0A1N7TA14_9TELE|nr:ATP synthase F0 subunit 8 [Herzensteinia microcephalus]AJY78513.1 ATP synthase F0 subunit 8 [Herzensteinia microcephalus]